MVLVRWPEGPGSDRKLVDLRQRLHRVADQADFQQLKLVDLAPTAIPTRSLNAIAEAQSAQQSAGHLLLEQASEIVVVKAADDLQPAAVFPQVLQTADHPRRLMLP
jgi:hypothetical protein